MNSLRDRSPNTTGDRSFFKKNITNLILLLLLGLGILFWYANQLIVSINPESGMPKQCFSVQAGDTWNIEFTHSVQLTKVEEYFRVNDVNDMLLTHTIYQSLGVGLPYSQTDGKLTRTIDGKFNLEILRPYKVVKLRTAVQAKPSIRHNNFVYDLCDLYGQGTLVEVKVEKRYQYWFNFL